MVKHLFKLIWKQKKTNFLMMSEIFISFLILFAVSTLCVFLFRNYKEAAGLKTENVLSLLNTIPSAILFPSIQFAADGLTTTELPDTSSCIKIARHSPTIFEDARPSNIVVQECMNIITIRVKIPDKIKLFFIDLKLYI